MSSCWRDFGMPIGLNAAYECICYTFMFTSIQVMKKHLREVNIDIEAVSFLKIIQWRLRRRMRVITVNMRWRWITVGVRWHARVIWMFLLTVMILWMLIRWIVAYWVSSWMTMVPMVLLRVSMVVRGILLLLIVHWYVLRRNVGAWLVDMVRRRWMIGW